MVKWLRRLVWVLIAGALFALGLLVGDEAESVELHRTLQMTRYDNAGTCDSVRLVPATGSATMLYEIRGAGVGGWQSRRMFRGDSLRVSVNVRPPAYGRADMYVLQAHAVKDNGLRSCTELVRLAFVRWDSVVVWK